MKVLTVSIMENASHQRAAERASYSKRGQSGGAVVRRSQNKDSRFKSPGCFFVWSLGVLPTSAWVLSSYSALGVGELAALN